MLALSLGANMRRREFITLLSSDDPNGGLDFLRFAEAAAP
jgi:hypothetical protein